MIPGLVDKGERKGERSLLLLCSSEMSFIIQGLLDFILIASNPSNIVIYTYIYVMELLPGQEQS